MTEYIKSKQLSDWNETERNHVIKGDLKIYQEERDKYTRVEIQLYTILVTERQ